MTLEASNNELMLYPLSLDFFSDDAKSWQPDMHLHNPCDHTIKFKVLTTAPNKYSVSIPEGSVEAKASVQLVVKHSSTAFSDNNITDKLRFKFFVDGSIMGKRDVPLHSVVDRREHVMSQMMAKANASYATYSNESSEDKYSNTSFAFGNSLPEMMAVQHEMTRSITKDIKGFNKNVRQKFYADQIALYNGDNVNYLVIIIGLFCLAILFLPNLMPESSAPSASTVFPAYLHVSYEIKLFCSFILGMVTMVILKN
ncbi:motile sperm domain-containing 1-like isoform X1 [Brachionus plicatilis]|uniref:Motile sperm domain-containing 1-like isoform X1 n=1 Tax=Brachionus plicatilis TaxID=10195 RepID=A0A3M7RA51_BRAPC|nr:motile sperm domain-containing 1-like isoform X1 [Brachionus plicatilis]